MKLVKPSFYIKEQEPGIQGIYKQIEWAGRHCYKSEDKITEDSAKPFVDRLIKSGHLSVLEQGTVYLFFKCCCYSQSDMKFIEKYENNPYSKVVYIGCDDNFIRKTKEGDIIYLGDILGCGIYGDMLYTITTNMRVLVENNWLDDLKYICKPIGLYERRITIKFITDQGILREFTRHRVFSFSVESTRYCNYSLDKFDKNITYIIPCWLDVPEEVIGIPDVEYWEFRNNEPFGHIGKIHDNIDYHVDKQVCRFLDTLNKCERDYFQLLEIGWKPQQARNVLPLDTKAEMIMTGFVSDWKNFFELRCANNAHPSARELAIPLREEFIKRGYINE